MSSLPPIVDSDGHRYRDLERLAQRALDGDEAGELEFMRVSARADSRYFVNNFCHIRDYQRGRDIRFRERPAQANLRETISDEQLVAALKARGVGWTWELAEFELWEIWRYAPAQVIYFCQREENAHDFIRRVRWSHARLPKELGYPPEQQPATKSRFAIITPDGAEGEILAFPSVPSAIQTYHPRRIIADEWGLIEEPILPSVLGALGLDGYFVGLGTAEGLRNEHANVYVSCRDGQPGYFAPEGRRFVHVFASWREDPNNCKVACANCNFEGTLSEARWTTETMRDKPRCPHCDLPALAQHWIRPSGGTEKDTERMFPENDREAFALTAPGEPVYPEFDANIHVAKEPLKADPSLPIIRGWDFGYNRPAAVVFQLNRLGQCVILAEFIEQNLDVEEFGRRVLEQCNIMFPRCRWSDWGDPSGRAHRETDGKSCFEILKRQLGLKLRPGKADWQRRRRSVATRLSRLTNGRPALIVDPRCRMLIEGFTGMYHYPVGRGAAPVHFGAFQRFREEGREAMVR